METIDNCIDPDIEDLTSYSKEDDIYKNVTLEDILYKEKPKFLIKNLSLIDKLKMNFNFQLFKRYLESTKEKRQLSFLLEDQYMKMATYIYKSACALSKKKKIKLLKKSKIIYKSLENYIY